MNNDQDEPTESWPVTVLGCLATAALIWLFLIL